MSVVAQQRPPPLYIYIYAGGGRLRAATADSSRTCAYAQHSVLQNRQRPHPLGDGCPAAKGFFFFPPFLRPSFFTKSAMTSLGVGLPCCRRFSPFFPPPPPLLCLRPVSFFPYSPPYFCPLFKRSFSLSIYIYSGVPNTVFDKKIAFEFLQKLEPPKK